MAQNPIEQIWEMLEGLEGTDWRSKPATVQTKFGPVDVTYYTDDDNAFALIGLPVPAGWFGILEGDWGGMEGLAYRVDGLTDEEFNSWDDTDEDEDEEEWDWDEHDEEDEVEAEKE